MNIQHTAIPLIAPLFLGLTAALLASAAPAAELPKRKPGLWEIKVRMDGMPNLGAMQQCIDQNTDNLMLQKGKADKRNCSEMDVRTTGNKVTIHAVCKVKGSTATTDGFFEGSFETRYTGTTKTRFVPPYQGMSESNMTHEGRWLGPCKPGQKPGDTVMPSLGGINLNDVLRRPAH